MPNQMKISEYRSTVESRSAPNLDSVLPLRATCPSRKSKIPATSTVNPAHIYNPGFSGAEKPKSTAAPILKTNPIIVNKSGVKRFSTRNSVEGAKISATSSLTFSITVKPHG